MTRYIGADGLYETLCNLWDKTDSEDFEKGVFETIINAPTADVVEAVRCKDCKKANTDECPISYWDDDLGKWRISYAGENWFCADGEREAKNDELHDRR